ncbi:glycosyltransferase family 4 protein [Tautonia rosea]|uniref:glycosyltransferase family 4 protein n=1 Tax=Tautonia rosea TaxID=2728037 RepID=UPI001475FF4B|nr:glycosyltransferase family 4 protein [Tautonia rosea]
MVTYVATIVPALRHMGHKAHILSTRVAEGGLIGPEAEGVIDLRHEDMRSSLLRQLSDSVRRQIDARSAVNYRQCRAISQAVRRITGGTPSGHILELEEVFGWPHRVRRDILVPIVVRLHGPWFLNGPNNGADPESREFAQRVREEGLGIAAANMVTAPSRDVLERTRAYYGLALDGAEVIPNPTPTVPEDRRWRPDQSDPDRLLFIGRFDLHKGGDTMIDAFALLQRDRPAARLTFVGQDRGLVRDGRHWQLKAYIEHRMPGALSAGLIEWLGPRPQSELEGLRRRAAVTVVASRYETFAITICEAMAAGCPLVATRAGGAGEVFEHETHGLYVRPSDSEDLAAALSRMLANPDRSAAMGAAAAEHCRRNYSPEVVAEQTLRFYRRVLAKSATQGILAQKETRP